MENNKGQALVGIIIVLVIVGLLGGGFYVYLQKQISVTPRITENSAKEEVTTSPTKGSTSPKEITPTEKNKKTTGQVPCVRETTKAGVTCGGTFYEDSCENLANGTGYANVRQCNASTGSSCSSLVSADRIFCSYGCQNGTCLSVPTQKEESTPPESVPSNPLETDKNPNWENLSWIIVFTNAGESLPEVIKSDLCNGAGTNKFSYLATWFKREANKYGVSLSLSLKCHDQQITLPQSVITTTDTYYAFGQAIPNSLDMQKTNDYLVQTIPSLLNYDLITVVHYRDSGASVADLAGIGSKVSYTFITKSNLVDGVQYYAPNVTEPNLDSDPALVKGVAHEALHSLRAKDHYDYNNFNCSDEIDKSARSLSIMCAANFNNFADYVVSTQTAKEIGWTN